MSDRVQLKLPSHTSDTQSSQSIFTPVTPSFIPTNQPTQVPLLGHDFSSISIQPKLTVSQPDDPYEQEADRVADEVMRMGDPMMSGGGVMRSPQDTIHRQCAACEEEEEVQAKLADSVVQRKARVMRSPGGGFQAGGNVESRLSSSKGGGSPLPDEVRSFMEPRFGVDFSQVRVHTGGESVQMNRELNAQAFAHKQDIYFGSGKAPAKDALTAHELTHVVQQTGAVKTKEAPDKPNIQLKCSACDEEAEVQRSPEISSVSEIEVQRSWFDDDDDDETEEPEESSGGGILDWAKEQASGAVNSVSQAGSDAYDWAEEKGSAAIDTVTQAGSDAYDWTKETGSAAVDTVSQAGGDAYDWAKETVGEYTTAFLEEKRAGVLAQINEAKQQLSGKELLHIPDSQLATLNNHLATLREKSQGLINIPGITATTDSATSATGEKAVGASSLNTLLTNLQSSISAPLTSPDSGSSDSGSVQGSIQRFLSPAAAAAMAAAAAAAGGVTEAGAVPAAGAAAPTGGFSIALLVVVALVVAVVVGIIVYASTRPSATPETAAPEMPRGLSKEKKEKWKKCEEMYKTYKKGTQAEVASLGSEIKSLKTKFNNDKNSLTPQEKKEVCAKVIEQLSLVERLINERTKYITEGCDEFDWFQRETTEEERRGSHQDELNNVRAQEGNLRGLLKELQDAGIC